MRKNISKTDIETQKILLLPGSYMRVFRQNIFRKNTNTTSGIMQQSTPAQYQSIEANPLYQLDILPGDPQSFKINQSPKNNAEIDRCSCVLRIAWANNLAEDNTLILGEVLRRGMVSVTINSVNCEASIFS